LRIGAQIAAQPPGFARTGLKPCAAPWNLRAFAVRSVAVALFPALVFLIAGCASGGVTASPTPSGLSISPGIRSIDTNCTGCNASNSKGLSVEQFKATLPNGDAPIVTWSLVGGDPKSGPGSITPSGQYTPPSYVTGDRAVVVVTATVNSSTKATSVLTVTPGFLQPLTPENAALGPGGQTTVTGFLAEAGGSNSISFALASTESGSSGGQGSLSSASCQRTSQAFTVCTVTYSAPPVIQSTGVTYVVATANGSTSKTSAALLLNAAAVSSTPATHQAQLTPQVQLGVSGGNTVDYDMHGNQVADCCGGTLGSLLQDNSGRQFLLSNNHVLARSDQASRGDLIVQPGLIDNNCTPFNQGPGTTQVGALSAWLPLSSKSTNADAAIAQVAPGTVDASGSILELGARQADGTLAAAPPGVSSSGGKGETAGLGMVVAKSGRTTGLTCGTVSALDLDVNVDYYQDCAETKPYLTKIFTHQLALSGNQFSDAGDSGSLVVDTANGEPVGLFFAGGMDASGVSQGVASPAPDVLNELGAQTGGASTYSFVGGADHGVSCLSYGDSTVAQAQARALSDAESTRAESALAQARLLVNPATGILGVNTGKSSDRPGEGAILMYVDEALAPAVPSVVDGVRTVVIPTSARAVSSGSAPQTAVGAGPTPLSVILLLEALNAKQQVRHSLMRQYPAFFGMGVGKSLDNPKEAALVIYVDRKRIPSALPAIVSGIRTRFVIMDRLHVTRSYATNVQATPRCLPGSSAQPPSQFDPSSLARTHRPALD